VAIPTRHKKTVLRSLWKLLFGFPSIQRGQEQTSDCPIAASGKNYFAAAFFFSSAA
jgi:hypothetical protein